MRPIVSEILASKTILPSSKARVKTHVRPSIGIIEMDIW